jgi:hypothetical protein
VERLTALFEKDHAAEVFRHQQAQAAKAAAAEEGGEAAAPPEPSPDDPQPLTGARPGPCLARPPAGSAALAQAADPPAFERPPAFPPRAAEEVAEKDRLLEEGFSNWNRRDFNAFCRCVGVCVGAVWVWAGGCVGVSGRCVGVGGCGCGRVAGWVGGCVGVGVMGAWTGLEGYWWGRWRPGAGCGRLRQAAARVLAQSGGRTAP